MAEDGHRLELARKSYEEVLDATKHQDDKIGRFLTAIAFLFTGAIAFGARSEVVGVRVDIGDRSIALPAIFLGLFLMLAVLSVLLLLVALGPNLSLPSPERDQREFEGKRRSRIFFLSMDKMTADEWWKEQWEDNPPSIEDAARNYVYDAHNLATKTTFKSGRTNEARATFSLALLFLGLSVVLTFTAASRAASKFALAAFDADAIAKYALPWDGVSRGLVAIAIYAIAFVLAYDYLRYEQTPDNYVDSRRRIWPYYGALVSVPALSILCLVPPTSPWTNIAMWTSLALVLMLVVALIVGLYAERENPPRSRKVWIVAYVLFGVLACVLSWRMYSRQHPAELLIGALVWVAILEIPRLSLGFRTWLRRTRLLNRHTYLQFKSPQSAPQGLSEAPSAPAARPDSTTPSDEP